MEAAAAEEQLTLLELAARVAVILRSLGVLPVLQAERPAALMEAEAEAVRADFLVEILDIALLLQAPVLLARLRALVLLLQVLPVWSALWELAAQAEAVEAAGAY
jgi:hypothetical protein